MAGGMCGMEAGVRGGVGGGQGGLHFRCSCVSPLGPAAAEERMPLRGLACRQRRRQPPLSAAERLLGLGWVGRVGVGEGGIALWPVAAACLLWGQPRSGCPLWGCSRLGRAALALLQHAPSGGSRGAAAPVWAAGASRSSSCRQPAAERLLGGGAGWGRGGRLVLGVGQTDGTEVPGKWSD